MELVVNNGRIIDPGPVKKAAARLARDPEAKVTLSFDDVATMVGNKLHADTLWLNRYTHFRVCFDPASETLTVTYLRKE